MATITKYVWIIYAVTILVGIEPSDAKFNRIYSQCYGLLFSDSQCSMVERHTEVISTEACQRKAEDNGLNAFAYQDLPETTQNDTGVEPLSNCLLYRCNNDEDGLLHGLRSVGEGYDLYYTESLVFDSQRHTRHADYTTFALKFILNIFGLKPIPFNYANTIIAFGLKTLVAIFNMLDDSYASIRDGVLRDIREELNKDAVHDMKIKLQDVQTAIKNLLEKLGTTNLTVSDWINDDGDIKLDHEIDTEIHNMTDGFKAELIAISSNLGLDRNVFTLRRDLYLSLPYYKEYALSHIFLLVMLQITYSSDARLHEIYHQETIEAAETHYLYLMDAIESAVHIVEKNRQSVLGNDLCFKLNLNQYNLRGYGVALARRRQCLRQELRDKYNTHVMADFMGSNKKFLKMVAATNFIVNHDQVALKFSDPELDTWFEFHDKGDETCTFTDCPDEGAPFRYKQTSGCSRLACPNSVFRIGSADRENSERLKTCDHVTLYRDLGADGDQLHLNEYCEFIGYPWCYIQTESAIFIASKKFTLLVPGKPCDEPILDRDVVAFVNEETKHLMTRGDDVEDFFGGGKVFAQNSGGCDYKESWIIFRRGTDAQVCTESKHYVYSFASTLKAMSAKVLILTLFFMFVQ